MNRLLNRSLPLSDYTTPHIRIVNQYLCGCKEVYRDFYSNTLIECDMHQHERLHEPPVD